MQTLQRGQKLKWETLSPELQLTVAVAATLPGSTLDFSCFGVDEARKLSDDRYFIFYNQKTSPEEALRMLEGASPGEQRFAVDLRRLPQTIRRLVFVITIDGPGEMRALQTGVVRLLDAKGAAVAEFPLRAAEFGAEKALIAGELYLKDGWRFTATGQGFNGGLSALLQHFGGEEKPDAASPPSPPPAPVAPSRLVLTKANATAKLNLSKEQGGGPPILVTAKWVDNGDGASDNDDLDLKAGVLLPDGRMHIIHAERLGALDRPPYVRHQGDVTGASQAVPGEERMQVNPRIAELLGGPVAVVFSVYSAVGNGAVSIASLHPVMRVQYGTQTIECVLDFTKDAKARHANVYTYVIGLAVVRGGEIEIMPSGIVSDPDSEATPWLTWDGKGGVVVTMNGPVVMKGSANAHAAKLNKKNPRRYEA